MPQKHIVIDARIRQSSTGRYIDRLLEHLQSVDTENRYTVLVRPGDPWKPSSELFTPLVCNYRGFSFNPFQQVAFSIFLYRLKADLVHFAMTGFQPLFFLGKQVTTTHDLTMFTFVRPGKLPGWLHWLRMQGYRLLIWHAHKHAANIIVPTQYVADAIAHKYPYSKQRIVVTLEASEPPLTIEPTKPKSVTEPFILYVGSAFPHKNLDKLVDAFSTLHSKYPDLNLVFAGKREQYYQKLETYAEDSPSKTNIMFTGFAQDSDLKWLYEHAKCYVFPSLSEGFGLPGLEAMAHGAPVASSDATCLPEVYGDAAVYFNPRDTKDIAAKISNVIDNPKLAKDLVEKGYAQVKKYSWKRMAEQTSDIYEENL